MAQRKQINDFLSDVSSGFQGASSMLGQATGMPQHMTPGPLPVVQTQMGTAATVTIPTQTAPMATPPASMHQSLFTTAPQIITPAPMGGGPMTAPSFGPGPIPMAANMSPTMDPYTANYMSGGSMQGMPSAAYTTPPGMGVYRPDVQRAPDARAARQVGRPGFASDAMDVAGGANWGMDMGIRKPLGYDPLSRGPASASRLVDRAFAATHSVTSFGAALGGSVAGEALGAWGGAAAGASIGGAIGFASPIPGGAAIGTAVGGFVGGVAGSGIGQQLGLGAAKINPMAHAMRMRADALKYQSGTRGIITTGADLDVTGTGLSRRASQRGNMQMYELAAESAIFNREDMQKMSQFATESGMMNMITSPDEMTRRMKEVAKSVKVFMAVAGDPDMQSAMKSMGDLYRMGVSVPKLTEAQSNIRQFARMAGVEVDEAMATFGASGGMMFKQQGLTQAAGAQVGVAAAGVSNALVQTGALSQADVNRLGGVQGMAQNLTGAVAGFMGRGIDPMLPGLLKIDPETGLPGIDTEKAQGFIRGEIDYDELIQDQRIFQGENADKNLQYVITNQEKIKADLADTIGPTGQIALLLQTAEAVHKRNPGIEWQAAAELVTGDRDTAFQLTQMRESPELLRGVVQQQRLETKRRGMAEYGSFMEEESVYQRRVARPLREAYVGAEKAVFGAGIEGLAGWEDALRAESQGMQTRQVGGIDLGRETEFGFKPGDKGARTKGFSELPHWYSVGGTQMEKAFMRGEGQEGLMATIEGAWLQQMDWLTPGSRFDTREQHEATAARHGTSFFGGGKYGIVGEGSTYMEGLRNQYFDAVVSASIVTRGDLGKDKRRDVSKKLVTTLGGEHKYDEALSLTREYAVKRGADNARLSISGLKKHLQKGGVEVSLEDSKGLLAMTADLHKDDEDVQRGIEMSVFTADAVENLGLVVGDASIEDIVDDAADALNKVGWDVWSTGAKKRTSVGHFSTIHEFGRSISELSELSSDAREEVLGHLVGASGDRTSKANRRNQVASKKELRASLKKHGVDMSADDLMSQLSGTPKAATSANWLAEQARDWEMGGFKGEGWDDVTKRVDIGMMLGETRRAGAASQRTQQMGRYLELLGEESGGVGSEGRQEWDRGLIKFGKDVREGLSVQKQLTRVQEMVDATGNTGGILVGKQDMERRLAAAAEVEVRGGRGAATGAQRAASESLLGLAGSANTMDRAARTMLYAAERMNGGRIREPGDLD